MYPSFCAVACRKHARLIKSSCEVQTLNKMLITNCFKLVNSENDLSITTGQKQLVSDTSLCICVTSKKPPEVVLEKVIFLGDHGPRLWCVLRGICFKLCQTGFLAPYSPQINMCD